jgi:hypothetical protein
MVSVLKERHFSIPWIVIILGFAFFIAACSSGAQSSPASTPIPTELPTEDDGPVVGTDIKVQLPQGDFENGDFLSGNLGCKGCHTIGERPLRFESGEGVPAVIERGEIRMADPAYEGNAGTNEEYIIESIVLPDVYKVEGEWGQFMPDHYGEILTAQDLADLFLWLNTFE